MKKTKFFVNPFKIISPKLNAELIRLDQSPSVNATEMTCLEDGLLIMLDKLIEMTHLMHRSLIEYDPEKTLKADKLAREIREQEKALTGDLVCSPSMNREVLQALVLFPDHLKRVGDMLESIMKVATIKARDGIYFSDKAHEELAQLYKTFLDILANFRTVLAIRDRGLLDHVISEGGTLDQMTLDFALAHGDRMCQGLCFPKASSLYLGVLDSARVANRHVLDMSHTLDQLPDSFQETELPEMMINKIARRL